MKLPFYALTVLIGVVLTVHLAMNGKVGSALDNPRVGNALFWCVGAVTALLIGLSSWQSGALKPLRDVSPVLLLAGGLGACLVFGIAFLIPPSSRS
jgi:transporter family-2 protein